VTNKDEDIKNSEDSESPESTENFDAKELLNSLIEIDKKRQISVNNLKQELKELEEGGREYSQTRIDWIKEELSIIDVDSMPETEEMEEENDPTERLKTVLTNIKRKHGTESISKALIICIILTLFINVFSVRAFGRGGFSIDDLGNIWTIDYYYEYEKVINGQTIKYIRFNDTDIYISTLRAYKSIDEFKEAEKIDIVVPEYIPGADKIFKIDYIVEVDINIIYSDKISLGIHLINKLHEPDEDDDNMEKYNYNDVNYYIFRNVQTIFWEYAGNMYSLVCSDGIEEYKEIIESIR